MVVKPSERWVNERCNDDAGVSIVLVALSVVTLLLFSALAIDGGRAYAQRRVTQNAVDAAAMAGARAVQQARFKVSSPPPPSSIETAVESALAENDAEPVECYLIRNDEDRTRVSPEFCISGILSSWTKQDLDDANAAGVEVRAKQTRETFFGGVAGFDAVTAETDAAATVQPMVIGGGAPFIVCGSAANDGYDILDATNSVKPSAIHQWFPLQYGSGSAFKRCGAGSDWKGKGNVGPVELGVWFLGDSGNGYEADIEQLVAGLVPCEGDDLDGCGMVIPIADVACSGNSCDDYGVDAGGGEDWLHIVAWTVWEVYGNGHGGGSTHPNCSNTSLSPDFAPPAPKYCGRLLGALTVTGGTGGIGDPLAGQAQVIQLVE